MGYFWCFESDLRSKVGIGTLIWAHFLQITRKLGLTKIRPLFPYPCYMAKPVLPIPMPVATPADPKSSLTNIIAGQIPKRDDSHTLENAEQLDPGGITYGNQKPIPTPKPQYGSQRMIPSAYEENELNIDPKELALGIAQEHEHTGDDEKARQIALEHLAEIPDYYSRLSKMETTAKTSDHVEIQMRQIDLPTKAMGNLDTDQLSRDRTVTQVPVTNIKQDVAGEAAIKRDEPLYNEGEDEDEDDEDFKEGTWVQAFRPGIHTDADGQTRKWTPKDVDKVAQQYNTASDPKNPERHVAPVVLGHPTDDAPAMGWVEKAKTVGGKLWLKLTELQPEFVDALKKGLYKTRSISLYPDLNIRHIGFLGASVPAVKGLAPFKFNDAQKAITIEFAEEEEVNPTEAIELKRENNFFKRVFDLFKVDVTNYAEKPSNVQSAETDTSKTIGNKYPEGATMAEATPGLQDLITVAGNYLDEAATITGAKAGKKDKAFEATKLAFDHLCKAYSQVTKETAKKAEKAEEAAETHEVAESPAKEKVEEAAVKAADHVEAVVPAVETPAVETPVAVNFQEVIAKLETELAQIKTERDQLVQTIGTKEKEERMQSFKEFCDGLVAEGRMRPVDVEPTIVNFKFREEMSKKESSDFAEGKATVANDYVQDYKDYLSAMPRVVEFAEFATKATATISTNSPGEYVEGKIKSFMEADPKMQYHTALNKLAETEPDRVQKYLEDSMSVA
jgi:hypothetical protein